MARSRELSKVLSSNTTLPNSYLTLSSASTTYAPVAAGSLVQIVPTSIATTGGSATSSISTNGAVTFSSASAISLNGIFSSTYENYKILFDGTITSSDFFNWRGRTSGTDNTSTSYSARTFGYGRDANSGLAATNSVNLGRIGTIAATSNKADMTVFNPQSTKSTVIVSSFINGSGDDFGYPILSTSFFSNTTSFDGISFIPTTGTITGTLRVYGYRN